MGHDRRVLVCGGAGYIGSHVVRALRQSGRSCVVVDDLSAGHRASLPEDVQLVAASVGDRSAMDRVFARSDFQAVIHLCANIDVGESVSNPGKYYRNNIANGLVLLEAMIDHGVRQFVFSSSAAVYGYPERVPIDENCRVRPVNPYGRTKAFFEEIIRDFGHAHRLRWVSLRYFNAAGAADEGDIGEDHRPETHLVPLVLRRALAGPADSKEGNAEPLRVFGDDYDTPDGTCVRDYIHVTDLADAHLLALEYLAAEQEPIALNLGNERGFTVLEVIRACEDIAGREIPFEVAPRRPGDPDRLVADAALARRVLNWQPGRSDIANVIRTAWRWHSRHPHGYGGPRGRGGVGDA